MLVPGGLICDPWPCDPGAINVVLRDFGALPILVFVAVSFVAGRKAWRGDLLLPALTAVAITAAFYAGFSQKMRFARQVLFSADDSALSDRLIEAARWEALSDYAVAWLVLVLIPLAVGLASGALNRRKLKLARAQQ